MSVASILIVVAGAGAVAAVVSSVLVSPAAVVAATLGAVALRIGYGEVVQTRLETARQSADQARSFLEASAEHHREHRAFAAVMGDRLRERDRALVELDGSVRSANRRADDAQSRLIRESRRADEVQRCLASLLDEVFGTADADADRDGDHRSLRPLAIAGREGGRADLPSVVDLLRWEEKGQSPSPGTAASRPGAVA